MKSSFKYIFAGILLGLGIFGGNAFSQTIKFNSIKPTASSQTLTDEQQGILAVRLAKASVVNIVGASKPLQPSADLTITVPSSSVSATGFVLDSSGLIITNDHVIRNALMEIREVCIEMGCRVSAGAGKANDRLRPHQGDEERSILHESETRRRILEGRDCGRRPEFIHGHHAMGVDVRKPEPTLMPSRAFRQCQAGQQSLKLCHGLGAPSDRTRG